MLLYKQLELFGDVAARVLDGATRFRASTASRSMSLAEPAAPPLAGPDSHLEQQAREMLLSLGAHNLVPLIRVVWSGRLRTAAGRADYQRNLISLNPLLHQQGEAEIDRTLRHELAHLVAHARRGPRRISPHGPEWRQACRDLGIA